MAVMLASVLTGLFGTVMRGPITPVCVAGKPCAAPAAGVTLTFLRGDKPVRSVRTSPTGRYRVVLAPGTYTVRLSPRARIQRLGPQTVIVRAGAPARRDFTIDTGIR